MSVSDDIGNLFQRFGGDPDRYQEVARDDDAKLAALRWPLLTALDIAQPEQVPGAGRPATALAGVQARSAARPVAGAQAEGARAANVTLEDHATHDPATSGMPRAPLFARGHRHATMPPPVDPARQAAARFSPTPHVPAAASEAEAAPRRAQAGMSTAVTPPATPASEASDVAALHTASTSDTSTTDMTTDTSRQPRTGLFANRKQTFAHTPITSAGSGHAQTAPRAAAAGSILSGLFAAPTTSEPPPRQPAARDLASVFARLAGMPARDRKKPDGERS